MKGLFITFEGPDGAGKTTQMKKLGDSLEQTGKSVVYTREPGGTAISEKIRAILLDPTNSKMSAKTEVLLYTAARSQHVEELIKPAVEAGKVVLCDRFTDSTIAYQGFGRGLDKVLLTTLNEVAIDGVSPDITIILDIDPEKGIRRISEKRAPVSGLSKDRIESENLDFHKRVREAFLSLAKTDSERCRIVDADKNAETIAREILGLVKEVLERENSKYR